MPNLNGSRRQLENWLLVAGLLLAVTLVSSMPVRDESETTTTTIATTVTTATPNGVQQARQRPRGRFVVDGIDYTCVRCNREIRGNYLRMPCGCKLHIWANCIDVLYRSTIPGGYNCPRCGPCQGTYGQERFRSYPRRIQFEDPEEPEEQMHEPDEAEEEDQDEEEVEGEGGDGLAEVCSICLNDARTATDSLECGHEFHRKCIAKWFKQLNLRGRPCLCPVCRHEQSGKGAGGGL